MSKQRTHKLMTKILWKPCSSLVKIIPDRENNFTQNKYNKLPKISAKKMFFFPKNKCKSAINSVFKFKIDYKKLLFILYKTHVTI